MATVAQISKNLDDMHDLVGQIVGMIAASDAEKAALRQQVADLIAAANISAAEKAALAAEVDAAFEKSETTENELRAVVPGVPPVGGTPLASSYADEASFRAAATAYTGPEAVTLNGTAVTTGNTGTSTGNLDYFSHSATGEVNTTGPSD